MAGYIYFMKRPSIIDGSSNTFAKQYIDSNQIDQKLDNGLTYDDLSFNKKNLSH